MGSNLEEEFEQTACCNVVLWESIIIGIIAGVNIRQYFDLNMVLCIVLAFVSGIAFMFLMLIKYTGVIMQVIASAYLTYTILDIINDSFNIYTKLGPVQLWGIRIVGFLVMLLLHFTFSGMIREMAGFNELGIKKVGYEKKQKEILVNGVFTLSEIETTINNICEKSNDKIVKLPKYEMEMKLFFMNGKLSSQQKEEIENSIKYSKNMYNNLWDNYGDCEKLIIRLRKEKRITKKNREKIEGYLYEAVVRMVEQEKFMNTNINKVMECIDKIKEEVERENFEREQEQKRKEKFEQQEEQKKKSKQECHENVKGTFNVFSGCNDLESLEKRYKQLMKIYHPDNPNGNTESTQEISKTYEILRKKFKV